MSERQARSKESGEVEVFLWPDARLGVIGSGRETVLMGTPRSHATVSESERQGGINRSRMKEDGGLAAMGRKRRRHIH